MSLKGFEFAPTVCTVFGARRKYHKNFQVLFHFFRQGASSQQSRSRIIDDP